MPVDDIVGQLKRIVESEKLKAEPEALTLIARQSAGGMRDAISLLDQMASTGKEITLGLTQTVLGTATSQTVIALIEAVLDAIRRPPAWMRIHTALDAGSDPRLLARQVVDYLRALLLIQMGNSSTCGPGGRHTPAGRKACQGLFPGGCTADDQIFQCGGYRPAWGLAAIPAAGVGAGRNDGNAPGHFPAKAFGGKACGYGEAREASE